MIFLDNEKLKLLFTETINNSPSIKNQNQTTHYEAKSSTFNYPLLVLISDIITKTRATIENIKYLTLITQLKNEHAVEVTLFIVIIIC